jgi:pimeloyl-ACP methyl ester carboxylesterase
MEEVCNGINQQFGNKPAIGVFHSISAVTAIKHALEFGKKWQALILFDPALVPGPGLSERDVGLEFELKLVKWAKNRPDGISNYRDLADNFSRAKTLKRWVPGAYELMAKSIMHRDNKVKKWFLNCPGIAESKNYEDNSKTHLTGFISELSVPVKFICADPNQPDALAPSKVGQAIHKECDISYVAIPNTSHLLQIEKPKECALALTSFINKLKIRS